MEALENYEELRSLHLDIKVGLKHADGSVQKYQRALYTALKSIKTKIPVLEDGLQRREYDHLLIIATTLNRIMLNIGADELSQESVALETVILNRFDDMVEDLLADYAEHLQCFLEDLETALRRMDHKVSVKPMEHGIVARAYVQSEAQEETQRESSLEEYQREVI